MVTMTVWLVKDSIDWSSVSCYNPSAESMWNAFMQILWSAIDMFVPSTICNNYTSVHKKNMANLRNHTNCEGVLLKSA